MVEFNMDLAFDSKNNTITIAGTRMVLHCHHYNSQLQQTLELTDYIDGRCIMKEAGEHVFFEQFKNYLKANKVEDRGKTEVAAEMYRNFGFGTLDFSKIGEKTVTANTSHFATGWLCKFGKRETPCCHFTAGYIAGVMRAITGRYYAAEEKECIAMKHRKCKFTLKETSEKQDGVKIKPFDFKPVELDKLAQKTNVDEEKVIESMSELEIRGDEEGLIPVFGVYLTIMPLEFYNRISYNFEKLLEEFQLGLSRSASELLIYAGVVCGIYTLGGIVKSQEWETIIAPMVKNREDKVHGIVAATNSLGWGRWRIIELKPGKRLVIKSYNPYEATWYRRVFGKSNGPKCYMLRGVAASIMDLAYTKEEEWGQFKFISDETKCIAKGDPYCEFVVTKNE